jgi:XTP/dITP diphosphohydrolase
VFDPAVEATDVAQLTVDWERRKVEEKGRGSVMDGIPPTLPSLAYAAKVQKKAASQGVDWRTLLSAGLDDPWAARVLDLVDEARQAGVDPELALRRTVLALADAYRLAPPT